MADPKTVHIILSGRVQGVGFRWFTRREANKLGVSGTAKNLVSGEVEVFARAMPEVLEEFKNVLNRGPSFGFVTDMRVTDVTPDREFEDFSIII